MARAVAPTTRPSPSRTTPPSASPNPRDRRNGPLTAARTSAWVAQPLGPSGNASKIEGVRQPVPPSVDAGTQRSSSANGPPSHPSPTSTEISSSSARNASSAERTSGRSAPGPPSPASSTCSKMISSTRGGRGKPARSTLALSRCASVPLGTQSLDCRLSCSKKASPPSIAAATASAAAIARHGREATSRPARAKPPATAPPRASPARSQHAAMAGPTVLTAAPGGAEGFAGSRMVSEFSPSLTMSTMASSCTPSACPPVVGAGAGAGAPSRRMPSATAGGARSPRRSSGAMVVAAAGRRGGVWRERVAPAPPRPASQSLSGGPEGFPPPPSLWTESHKLSVWIN